MIVLISVQIGHNYLKCYRAKEFTVEIRTYTNVSEIV